MKKGLVLAHAGVFAAALLASGVASAATVVATGGFVQANGAYPTQVVSGTITDPVTKVVTQSSGLAGVAKFNRTGGDASYELLPAGAFYGICLEFNEQLAIDPKTWDLNPLSEAPKDANGAVGAPGMGAQRASDLARLLNGAYPNWGSTLTKAEATALQLVVWEIAVESSGTYNLLDGVIKFDKNTVTSEAWRLANEYVAKLGAGCTTGCFTDATMYYMALTNDGNQDFVIKTVPLPAAAWLLLSGLVGFAALSRRRKPVEA